MSLSNTTQLTFIVFISVFALYLLTCQPSVGYIDSPIYIEKAWNLDLGFGSTDHPLFLVFCKVFQFLPLGSIAFRSNIFSGFIGSLTISIFLYLFRMYAKRALFSLAIVIAPLALATSHTFWWVATEVEVYTFMALFIIILLYLCERYKRSQTVTQLLLLWFVAGLSLWGHQLLILLFPAILWWSWRFRNQTVKELSFAIVTGGTIGFVLPMALFILLSSRDLIEMISGLTGGEFQAHFFSSQSISELPSVALRFIFLYLIQWYPLHFVIIICGAVQMYRQERDRFILAILMIVPVLIFVFGYHVPDRLYFYLPIFVVSILFLYHGIMYFIEKITLKRNIFRAIAYGLIIFPIFSKPLQYQIAPDFIRWRLPELEKKGLSVYLPEIPGRDTLKHYINPIKRNDWSAHHFQRILSAVPQGSLIIDDWYHGYAIMKNYFQGIEKMRPDVEVLRWFVVYGGTKSDREKVIKAIQESPLDRPIIVISDEYPANVLIEKLKKDKSYRVEQAGLWHRIIR